MTERVRRLLYGWRFTNWLIAVLPNPLRWKWRVMYRAEREGAPRDHPVVQRHPSMYRPPKTRLAAAWAALTFPHVHGEWDD